MARLSQKHKAGTGNSERTNKRKLEDSNNLNGRNPQKKQAPAASSTPTAGSATGTEEAATESFSPGSEAVGMQSDSPPSATDKPVAGRSSRSSRSSKNSHSRLSDKKGEAPAPPIAKLMRNNAKFIQFVLASEEECHEIAEELSVKGFENLNDKMLSTMPQIRACMVGDKIMVEVELLGTSIQQQHVQSTEPNEVAAVPAPTVVDNPRSLRFNDRQVNFKLILESKLDCESSNLNKHGCGRNADAVRQAQSRARKRIAEAVKLAGCTKEQQALALHLALLHADIQETAETAGFKNETSKAVACQWEQMREIMQDATKNKGTLNSSQERFLNAIFAAAAPDGRLVPDPDAPSMETQQQFRKKPFVVLLGLLPRRLALALARSSNDPFLVRLQLPRVACAVQPDLPGKRGSTMHSKKAHSNNSLSCPIAAFETPKLPLSPSVPPFNWLSDG